MKRYMIHHFIFARNIILQITDFEITVNELQNHPDLEQKRSLQSNFLSIRCFFLSIQCCVIRNSRLNLIPTIETCSRRLNNPELAAQSVMVRTYTVYQSRLWRRTLIAVKLLPVYHVSTLQTYSEFSYWTSQNNGSNYKH